MNRNKRPLAVTILACVYIAVGTIGLVYHVGELHGANPFEYGALSVEATELVAIVCGAFMLPGHNWARWVAVAWMAFHVILSAFHSLGQFAIHLLFLAVIAWFLFRPDAARYFRGARTEPT